MSEKADKQPNILGFTIIEVAIVLGVGALILLIVFLVVPTLQAASRDYRRKDYATHIVAAVINYGSTYGHYPDCSHGRNPAACPIAKSNATQFMRNELPDGVDPVTGQDYKNDTIQDYSTGGISNASHSIIYLYDEEYINHAVKPQEDQFIIAAGHFCNTAGGSDTLSDGGPTLWANQQQSVAVLTPLERGGIYCTDNAN